MKALDDKKVVKEYFNATGFDRWRRIYGDGEVSKVQRDIRIGHQQTIDTVLQWLEADGNLSKLTICDAGCGVGSLAIPLAKAGAQVSASDISEKMVTEAQSRAQAALPNGKEISWKVSDLESLSGSYDMVICLDVLIHYPQDDAARMIEHLATLSRSRLILSFAPKTFWLTILKKIGEFFPGPSKTTRAYQHREEDIRQVLQQCGFEIQRQETIGTRFYFARLLEATRKA